jgi:hypothetical protein
MNQGSFEHESKLQVEFATGQVLRPVCARLDEALRPVCDGGVMPHSVSSRSQAGPWIDPNMASS